MVRPKRVATRARWSTGGQVPSCRAGEFFAALPLWRRLFPEHCTGWSGWCATFISAM